MFENRSVLYSFLTGIFTAFSCYPSFAQEENTYLGVGSCASSNCHGGVSASPQPGILRNEFYTWYKFDKHSKSYTTLLNDESKRIAYHLGIGEPHKEALCLDCHATSAKIKGEKFRVEDGVGCESCHGASNSWIQSHTEQEATHARNLKDGLNDLSSLPKRALLCASCHFGDGTKEVTHRLYGAGHPRLSFELDTFEAVQPRHWKIDADYIDRKGAYRPTEGWAYGQLELARLQIEQLQRHSGSKELFPEFSQFTCFSCHQSLNSKSFMNRERTSTPGYPRYNFTHLEMVSLLLRITDHPEAHAWNEDLQAAKNSGINPEVLFSLEKLQKRLNSIKLLKESLTPRRIVSTLSHFEAVTGPGIDQQLAEQLVMALSASNSEEPLIPKNKLKALYVLVERPETFNSSYFSTALKSLQ